MLGTTIYTSGCTVGTKEKNGSLPDILQHLPFQMGPQAKADGVGYLVTLYLLPS
jgi:hypothetical protein